jgi:hypothetical protein
MGKLDEGPFQVACKRKYRDDNPEGKAARSQGCRRYRSYPGVGLPLFRSTEKIRCQSNFSTTCIHAFPCSEFCVR